MATPYRPPATIRHLAGFYRAAQRAPSASWDDPPRLVRAHRALIRMGPRATARRWVEHEIGGPIPKTRRPPRRARSCDVTAARVIAFTTRWGRVPSRTHHCDQPDEPLLARALRGARARQPGYLALRCELLRVGWRYIEMD